MSDPAPEWAKIKAAFRRAIDAPPDERDAILDEIGHEDAAVRAEVERLLAHHDAHSPFMDRPAFEVHGVTAAPAHDGAPDPLVGTTVGAFRLVRRIAVGGMGAVYEAEQDSPRRTVAVKVLRPGLASGSLMKRFEFEAEVLGRLQHPGIAQIFEAGSFDHGAGRQPYFAMELIDGAPIDDVADAAELSTRQRLSLLMKIAAAVQHAHAKGVVHRDLKPGNILMDTAGEPKILDFGIARAIDADVQMTTMHTSVGELVGTINYMSPEQVEGDPDEIDARSDVYALGVIGYELLTGRLPYDIRGKSIPEALRLIADADPVPMSSVRRVLRGDLETIFAKAIEKAKARRYQSAAEFAADIERYLRDEPIVARPPTTFYQLSKFARRNRAIVIGVAAAFVALTIGLIAAVVQARRATFEAERFAYEAGKSRALNNYITNDFLMKLLAQVGEATEGSNVAVADLVDAATDNVSKLYGDEPAMEATIRNELGTMYYNLGRFDASEREFGHALDLWESALGPEHVDTLKAVNNKGQAIAKQGRGDEAAPYYRRALDGRLAALGEEDPFTLITMSNLAMILPEERADEAAQLMQRAADIQARVHGWNDKTTLHFQLNLGRMLIGAGDLEGAEAAHRRALAGLREIAGEDHPHTMVATSVLARTLRHRGKLDEAEPLLRHITEAHVRTLGEEHRDSIVALTNLANLVEEKGDLVEAEAILRRVVSIDHGDGFKRSTLLRERAGLARLASRQGRVDEALAAFEDVLADARTELRADSVTTGLILTDMAGALRRAGDAAEAVGAALEAHGILASRRGNAHENTRAAATELAEIYEALGRPDDAATWAARARPPSNSG